MLSFSGVQSESKEKLKFQLHYLTTKSLQVPCKFPLNKLKKNGVIGKEGTAIHLLKGKYLFKSVLNT